MSSNNNDDGRTDRSVSEKSSISVIMPVYNGRDYIQRSLPPLIALRDRGAVSEVIVVNDGSTDGSDDLAAELGATVIHLPGPLGPGAARNVAVDMAHGDLAWFVDADVLVVPESADHIGEIFADESVAAAFGSYDVRTPSENFASRYKKLVHYYCCSQAGTDASTFWAGCGIVRRDAFRRISGFDAKRFRRSSVEDIELASRLRADGGRIVFDPTLLCEPLKISTLRSVVTTDFFQRPLTWSRLILARGRQIKGLKPGKTERLRASLASLLILSLGAPLAGTPFAAITAASVLAVLAANFALFTLLLRRNGLLFSVAGLLFHQVYYLCGSVSYLSCWLENRIGSRESVPGRGRNLAR